MVRVGIMGATGYTGLELLRILTQHPGVEVCWVGSESFPDVKLEDYCPAWRGRSSLTLQKQEIEKLEGVEVIFLALPSGVAMDYVPFLLSRGIRIIDLGADFRLKNVEAFQKYYRLEHRIPYLLQEAVYGIPEIYGEELKMARLVANPGCYPTSVIIPLYPFLKEKVISPSIIVDSKSGVTGAGRKPTEDNQFCEVDENFKAYKVGEHRHQPEIKEQLELAAREEVNLIFTPYLLPLKRGILTTIYITLEKDIKTPVVPSKILSIMSAGKPVLATMNLDGDAPELIKKANCGYVFEAGDSKSLANGILRLYKNESLRKKLGENGRKYIEEHLSVKTAAEKYEKLFIEVITKNNKTK
ncbi:MAG: N-acetyl-gamma-glutamyl-phosphate reductase [Candidatus Atribacteria bacterium]|nr:N-acetyl-gamma-glutamyl-phosphate reductase [Candidatus Atribacteria bacterium]